MSNESQSVCLNGGFKVIDWMVKRVASGDKTLAQNIHNFSKIPEVSALSNRPYFELDDHAVEIGAHGLWDAIYPLMWMEMEAGNGPDLSHEEFEMLLDNPPFEAQLIVVASELLESVEPELSNRDRVDSALGQLKSSIDALGEGGENVFRTSNNYHVVERLYAETE